MDCYHNVKSTLSFANQGLQVLVQSCDDSNGFSSTSFHWILLSHLAQRQSDTSQKLAAHFDHVNYFSMKKNLFWYTHADLAQVSKFRTNHHLQGETTCSHYFRLNGLYLFRLASVTLCLLISILHYCLKEACVLQVLIYIHDQYFLYNFNPRGQHYFINAIRCSHQINCFIKLFFLRF